ncbi:unnamed protein product [Linum trigynum]|uniref:Uncharacterized protein n=1 Tax=Linum trigynum TaxID=586398 RepID=A0AAV2DVT6_9ROSI
MIRECLSEPSAKKRNCHFVRDCNRQYRIHKRLSVCLVSPGGSSIESEAPAPGLSLPAVTTNRSTHRFHFLPPSRAPISWSRTLPSPPAALIPTRAEYQPIDPRALSRRDGVFCSGNRASRSDPAKIPTSPPPLKLHNDLNLETIPLHPSASAA